MHQRAQLSLPLALEREALLDAASPQDGIAERARHSMRRPAQPQAALQPKAALLALFREITARSPQAAAAMKARSRQVAAATQQVTGPAAPISPRPPSAFGSE